MLAIIVGQLGINVLCPDGSNDCPYQNVVTNVSAFIQSMTSLLVISFCWQSINFSLHKYPIWVWQYDQRTWISIALDLILCFQVLEASLSVPFAYPVLQAVSSILIFFVGLASVKFPIFLGEATYLLLVKSFCIGETHNLLSIPQMLVWPGFNPNFC